jgi:hypothetical protein
MLHVHALKKLQKRVSQIVAMQRTDLSVLPLSKLRRLSCYLCEEGDIRHAQEAKGRAGGEENEICQPRANPPLVGEGHASWAKATSLPGEAANRNFNFIQCHITILNLTTGIHLQLWYSFIHFQNHSINSFDPSAVFATSSLLFHQSRVNKVSCPPSTYTHDLLRYLSIWISESLTSA